jgi:hypothetical protein
MLPMQDGRRHLNHLGNKTKMLRFMIRGRKIFRSIYFVFTATFGLVLTSCSETESIKSAVVEYINDKYKNFSVSKLIINEGDHQNVYVDAVVINQVGTTKKFSLLLQKKYRWSVVGCCDSPTGCPPP